MIEKPQRVEIYLAPCRRTDREIEAVGEIEEELRTQLQLKGIRSPLIIGNSIHSEFDYAVENLGRNDATKLVEAINQLEGYAAKSREWLP
ncbi:hypothetical protein CMI37_27105 [Candidatus Pacearchaeota archaeon]|nr:hypothetical protein [Candidatus Pacearchaeota archaeon]|tara:strand:- start:1779 stop:2048 length:270 start_codon:yes stop_codon:yes gene_type:complete